MENEGIEPSIPACKAGVFPLALIPRDYLIRESRVVALSRVVARAGFEPATHWASTSRSTIGATSPRPDSHRTTRLYLAFGRNFPTVFSGGSGIRTHGSTDAERRFSRP